MSKVKQACKKDIPFENFSVDYDIIQDCVIRLNKITQAFDVLGMSVAANELGDVSYTVKAIFEEVKIDVDGLEKRDEVYPA